MGASSSSPLPEHYDAISHKRDLALKALRLGDRLLEEAAGVLERKLRCGWIPVSIRAGKRPSRVVSKIERIFQRAVEKGETITFDNALSRIKDFAGGRFLIPYLRDVGDARQIFCEFIKKKRLAVLDGEAEDYNTNPQPSGYRGLHQGLLAVVN